ncbi:PREDICTED: uncharacterized protein LOC109482903 [Branchiostoma belcheri]|uniref:Uncharacterized protein LOC109482903 n=1 Tax=Branchiostoma belcheri TaxID=7741 RepID=A0A6P5ADI7_BRABE|nr:PREDICTED: uncharacterized protein LOC109482903 [Branchiostoma belcheri]XP_019641348.1 PREDICTED: uncharacterized protein LOC109482903 [Branchiostoma belcheri]
MNRHAVGPLHPFPRQFDTVDELLEYYWRRGYQYAEISQLLLRVHNINLNVRQIKYRFKKLGLLRYGGADPDDAVRRAIQEELQGPNKHYGYRRMHRCLVRDHGLNVRRITVQHILREEDPEGSEQRRRRRLSRRQYFSLGPNMTWHIDGNDKLRPYGFCIHGCIDGYSRRILWLKVGPTNKCPKVVAGFYLDTVCQLGGCPLVVRSDPGSENVVVAAIQGTFRATGDDEYSGPRSHQYGKSVHNQRIEAFWSHLKPKLVFWIQVFQGLVDDGDLELGNSIHTWCLQFCFMPIVARDLNSFAEDWNDRRIPPHHSASVPAGRPNILHFLPEQTGGRDMLQVVPGGMLRAARCHCKPYSMVGNESFQRYAGEMLTRMDRTTPNSIIEALDLYRELVVIATAM